MSIELMNPGAFTGALLEFDQNFELRADSMLYYSFITLLTIGYGEIVPVIPIAQKAAILVGLIGQFLYGNKSLLLSSKSIFLYPIRKINLVAKWKNQ